VGAFRTIDAVMFVSAVTIGGIGRSGLMSVSNTVVAVPSRTSTTAISVIRSPGTCTRAGRFDVDNDERFVTKTSRSDDRSSDGCGEVAQSPAARAVADKPPMSSEQRASHVFGDIQWRAWQLADVRDQ
jgi:hypothetical protein